MVKKVCLCLNSLVKVLDFLCFRVDFEVVLFSECCSQRVIIVVIVLIMKGMCQFQVCSLFLFSNCCRIIIISIVSNCLLIRVMYWNEVKKLCWFLSVILFMQVVLVLYLLFIDRFWNICVSNSRVGVRVLMLVQVGMQVIVRELVYIIIIEISMVVLCLCLLVMWLNIQLLMGCMRKLVVKILVVFSNCIVGLLEGKKVGVKQIVQKVQMQKLNYFMRLLEEVLMMVKMCLWCFLLLYW